MLNVVLRAFEGLFYYVVWEGLHESLRYKGSKQSCICIFWIYGLKMYLHFNVFNSNKKVNHTNCGETRSVYSKPPLKKPSTYYRVNKDIRRNSKSFDLFFFNVNSFSCEVSWGKFTFMQLVLAESD